MPYRNCKICKNEFYVKPSHLKLGYGKFCSIKCRGIGQRKGKYVICDSCGKETWKMPRHLKNSKSGKFFCSKSCQTKWRNKFYSGQKHPNWRGGEFTYQRIMAKYSKPKCAKCGIKNKKVLVIHHLDHNRRNNNIKNLIWLCRNCHYLIHNGKTL